jgi:glycosyltransferase involved in cell wall biosynthesis
LKPTVSIVVPIYNEAKGLELLFYRLAQLVVAETRVYFEFVFVNDGSSDASFTELVRLQNNLPDVILIDLSRNFGKEVALSAGLEHAGGDAVAFMDSDLQHPPEYLPKFIDRWFEGFEVVASVRVEHEKEGWLRILFSRAFYLLLGSISDLKMVSKTTDFRLIDSKVANEIRKITEKQRIFRGLIDWLGYKKCYVNFTAAERTTGKANYSYKKLAGLALDTLIGNSTIPLLFVGYLGMLIVMTGVGALCVVVFDRFLGGNQFSFSNLAILVLLNYIFTGVILTALGLMSLYLRKVYGETQGRPLYVTREIRKPKDQSR